MPGANTETAGNQWMTTAAKKMTRTTATTNSGSAVTPSDVTDSTWSNRLSRRAAASTPSPTPISVPIAPARTTRTSEFRMRPPMSVLTGCPLASDLPKLPCSTPVSQVQYCSTAGRVRPSCTSSACRRCGVAVFSSTALAALPGRIWVAANTRIDTSTSVRIPIRLRLITRSRMGCGGAALDVGPTRPGASVAVVTIATHS